MRLNEGMSRGNLSKMEKAIGNDKGEKIAQSIFATEQICGKTNSRKNKFAEKQIRSRTNNTQTKYTTSSGQKEKKQVKNYSVKF